jgi:tetratricopeptide (TPR) repeat protein
MQNIQNNFQDLTKCTVAIHEPGDSDKVLGTGVIVTDDGLILTCYHVIGNLKSGTIDFKNVDIYFPSVPNIEGHANLEYSDVSSDIVILQLQGKLPEQVAVANLSEKIVPTHSFQSFGFRREKTFDGLYSDGVIQGKVEKKFKTDDNNISLQEVIQLKSDGIDHGMSGAAVLDTQISRVVGIVSEYLATLSNVDKNLALAIPIGSVIKVYPELRERNLGLRKFNNFLQSIRKNGSPIYDRFEDTYVPPIEYDEIEKTLKDSSCVFIIGTAEYGKRYTAIKLLWEYYQTGYTIRYVEDSQEIDQMVRKLTDQNPSLKHSIVYFDAPLGKIDYKANGEFEESIGIIIPALSRLDIYLVVTMRGEIYQKFDPLGKKELEKHVKKMIIGNHSYDYEKRKEMLLRWASLKKCKWLQDEKLKAKVLEVIKNEIKLPTPLNLREFTSATAEILDETEILKILDSKSQRTPERFAKEIKLMSVDKMLFLCFPFVSERFSIDFVKENYYKLVKVLDAEDYAWKFDTVLEWFKDDKVDISYIYSDDIKIKGNVVVFDVPAEKFLTDPEMQLEVVKLLKNQKLDTASKEGSRSRIKFSHPSYFEAIQFVISEETNVTKEGKIPFHNILSSLLINLADDEFAVSAVCNTVASNFDRLPKDVQNLLFKLADNAYSAGSVAIAVSDYFDRLPKDVQNLLLKISGNKEANVAMASALSRNYDKLPEEIREILFKLSYINDKKAELMSYAIFPYLGKIIKDFAKEESAMDTWFRPPVNMIDYLSMLPEDARNKLLERLRKYEYPFPTSSHESTDVWYNKGSALINLGKYEEAIECFNRAIRIDANHADAWSNKGIALRNLGKYNEAIDSYNKAIEIDHNNANAWYHKGNALRILGKYNEAIDSYNKAIEIDHNNANAMYGKGLSLDISGEHNKALAPKLTAETVERPDIIQLIRQAKDHNSVLRLLASIDGNIEIEKKIRSVAEIYRVARERREKITATPDPTIDYNPDSAITEEELQKAIAWLKKADAAIRAESSANIQMGHNSFEGGNYEDALKYYEKALKIEPRNVYALNYAGLSLAKLQKYERAIMYFDQALDVDRNNVFALTFKGISLGGLQKYNDAIESYDEALAIEPNNFRALVSKGADLNNLGDYNQAIECYNKAIKIDSNSGAAWHYKGIALLKLGKQNDADRCFAKAKELGFES